MPQKVGAGLLQVEAEGGPRWMEARRRAKLTAQHKTFWRTAVWCRPACQAEATQRAHHMKAICQSSVLKLAWATEAPFIAPTCEAPSLGCRLLLRRISSGKPIR